MHELEELRNRLDRAAGIADPLDRRLWVLGVISELTARKSWRPILVGGCAVEFYTSGGYSTIDVDVITDSDLNYAEAMRQLGFEKLGRFWLRDDLGIAIESHSGPLAGDRDHITEVQVEDMTVHVIGVEDLIVDRLTAFVHWASQEDGRWARRLLREHGGSIDWDYPRKRADEEKVGQALSDLAGGTA